MLYPIISVVLLRCGKYQWVYWIALIIRSRCNITILSSRYVDYFINRHVLMHDMAELFLRAITYTQIFNGTVWAEVLRRNNPQTARFCRNCVCFAIAIMLADALAPKIKARAYHCIDCEKYFARALVLLDIMLFSPNWWTGGQLLHVICVAAFCHMKVSYSVVSVRNWENIYRSNVQVTVELCGHFRCLQVLYFK